MFSGLYSHRLNHLTILISLLFSSVSFTADTYIYYNFDDNVNDHSGFGNDGSLQGTGSTYNSSGYLGKSIQLDGNGYLSMPNNLILDNTNFTISLYFKTTFSNMVIMAYQNVSLWCTH